MKPSEEIFDLIKAMTPSEKRYFRLNASVQGGDKKYIRLFDLISAARTYDEPGLKKALDDKGSFVHTKNYLLKLIYRSLSRFAEEDSPEAMLGTILMQCRALYEKGLYRHYFRAVKKGKLEAMRYERFGFALEFINSGKKLRKKEEAGLKHSVVSLTEEELLLGKIKRLSELSVVVSELMEFRRLYGKVRNEAEAEMISRLEGRLGRKEFPSVTSQERELFAGYLCAAARGSNAKAVSFAVKRYELVKANPLVFKGSLPDVLADSVTDMVMALCDAGKVRTAQEKLSHLTKGSRGGDSGYPSESAYIRLSRHDLSGSELLEAGAELVRAEGKFTVATIAMLRYKLAQRLMERELYAEALAELDRLLRRKTLSFTPFIEPDARVSFAICHYRLGNFMLVRHLVESIRKTLRKKSRLYPEHEAILSEIRKLSQAG